MFRLEEFPYSTGLKTNKVQRHYEYVFFLMWRQLIGMKYITHTPSHPFHRQINLYWKSTF